MIGGIFFLLVFAIGVVLYWRYWRHPKWKVKTFKGRNSNYQDVIKIKLTRGWRPGLVISQVEPWDAKFVTKLPEQIELAQERADTLNGLKK